MSEQIFTIVVADDEEELREAVCRMIRWEEIGFRLVGSAGNGLDALQMVEQPQPDLLLTDIRMPFITGTALARQVRELQPLIQVAFLSGYDDFEYAQRAIESDVIAYLLKPISMAELTESLREIHDKMESRFNALKPAGGRGSLPLAVASLLLDSFAEQPEEAKLQQMLADCGMVFTAPYALAVLAIRAGQLEQDAAQTVDQVLRKYYISCSIVSGGRVLSLLVSEDDFARLGAALDELYYVGKRLLDESCVIGVSRSFSQLRRCTSACREAVDIQRLAGESGIYRISQIQAKLEDRAEDEQDTAARLATLLYSGSRQELEDYLTHIFADSGSDMTAMRLLLAAQSALERSLEDGEVALLLHRCGLDDPLATARDRELFRRRITDLCLAGRDRLSENRREGVSFLCDQALRLIEQNYMDEELSLNAVSEQLHVSPNYLSANMKKYTGDTFINLLIKRRMEAALALLQGGGLKVAEIAGRCGYSDQHYFSYCFKKYYGVSPARMRRGEGSE